MLAVNSVSDFFFHYIQQEIRLKSATILHRQNMTSVTCGTDWHMAVGIQTEVSEYTPPQAQQLRNTEKYQACFTTGLIASSQEGHSAGNYQNLEQLPLLTQMMSSRVPSLSSHHYIWYQSPRLRKFPA